MKPVEQDMTQLPEDELTDAKQLEEEDACVSEAAVAQESIWHEAATAGKEKGQQDREGDTRDIEKEEESQTKQNQCAQETTPAPEAREEAEKKAGAPVSQIKQKYVAFSELPGNTVDLARNSVIPPAIMEYYKQFGLDEETIKLIFQVQPSEAASHKPVDLPPLQGSPKPGG
ncbi:MAG: hypothetical protein HPY58_03885 [Firmicutes bacterium]|nr:hypothetical protein [Bacillota bacterium]